MHSFLRKPIFFFFLSALMSNCLAMDDKVIDKGKKDNKVEENKQEALQKQIHLPVPTWKECAQRIPKKRAPAQPQNSKQDLEEQGSTQENKTVQTAINLSEDQSYLFEEITFMDPAEVQLMLDSTPEELRYIFNIRRLIEKKIIKKPTIIFFVGEPGVGKTELAKAITMRLHLDAWLINCPGLRTFYASHATTRIKEIFRLFKQLDKPHVLIFDEINQLMNKTDDKEDESRRGETSSCFWECLDSNANNPNLILIATANDLDKLPDQLKSRIHISIYKISPNHNIDIIKRLITTHLADYNGMNDKDLRALARMAANKRFSAREITHAIYQALKIEQCKQLRDVPDDELDEKNEAIKISYNDLNTQFSRLAVNRRVTQIDKPFYKSAWDNLGKLAKTEQYRGFILPFSQIAFHLIIQVAIQYWSHRVNRSLHKESLAIAAAGLALHKLSFMQTRLQHIIQAYTNRYGNDFFQGASSLIAKATSFNSEKEAMINYINQSDQQIDNVQEHLFNQPPFNTQLSSMKNPIGQVVHRSPFFIFSWAYRALSGL